MGRVSHTTIVSNIKLNKIDNFEVTYVDEKIICTFGKSLMLTMRTEPQS